MLHFQLFRIKVQEPAQKSFLFSNKPTSELLVLAIKEKPSAELRKGYTWHIGNIFLLDDEGLYFALGRTANSIVESATTRNVATLPKKSLRPRLTLMFCLT